MPFVMFCISMRDLVLYVGMQIFFTQNRIFDFIGMAISGLFIIAMIAVLIKFGKAIKRSLSAHQKVAAATIIPLTSRVTSGGYENEKADEEKRETQALASNTSEESLFPTETLKQMLVLTHGFKKDTRMRYGFMMNYLIRAILYGIIAVSLKSYPVI